MTSILGNQEAREAHIYTMRGILTVFFHLMTSNCKASRIFNRVTKITTHQQHWQVYIVPDSSSSSGTEELPEN
jgi:hypothetical protein